MTASAAPATTHTSEPEELVRHRQQLEAIKAQARQLVAGVTPDQLTWHPAPGRWSIGECLVHLNLTGEVYVKVLGRAIERARGGEVLGAGLLPGGLIARAFVWSMEPPPRVKVRAPLSVRPPAGATAQPPMEQVVASFLELQDKLIALLDGAAGIDLRRIRVRSPRLTALRMTVSDTYAITAAHERRHLWQAQQVKRAEGFPAA